MVQRSIVATTTVSVEPSGKQQKKLGVASGWKLDAVLPKQHLYTRSSKMTQIMHIVISISTSIKDRVFLVIVFPAVDDSTLMHSAPGQKPGLAPASTAHVEPRVELRLLCRHMEPATNGTSCELSRTCRLPSETMFLPECKLNGDNHPWSEGRDALLQTCISPSDKLLRNCVGVSSSCKNKVRKSSCKSCLYQNESILHRLHLHKRVLNLMRLMRA